jgi:hypothetical protein
VSICVSNVSENRRKVESCSVGEMLFHSRLVVMLGVGGGDATAVIGAIGGVRICGLVGGGWER